MLCIAAIVLSVVALSSAYPVPAGYPGYNPQPLYYYYYTPTGYPTTSGYAPSTGYPTATGYTPGYPATYPLSYAPGYNTPTQYAPLASTGVSTTGYTFGTASTSDAPTTTTPLPTLQTLSEFLQSLIATIQRPFKPASGSTETTTGSDEATGTTYYTNPQSNTLFVRPTTNRYSYTYPGGQAYAGSPSYYPYSIYFPRYQQSSQSLTTV